MDDLAAAQINQTLFGCLRGLIISSLAVIATSPVKWIVDSVTNLEYYQDGIVYAADVRKEQNNIYPVAVSMDGGLTWEEATDVNTIELKS